MSRILEALNKYDSSLTLAELIEKLETEQKEAIIKEEEDFHKIRHEYKNTYFKIIDEHSLFGDTLRVYYIEDIVNKAKNTDWEDMYYIKGTRISFSKRDVHLINKSGKDVNDSLSIKELKNMEEITSVEFYKYLDEYHKILEKLSNLLK